jgi:hypothetical protein
MYKENKGYGSSFSCTDLLILADKTGISYAILEKIFSNENQNYTDFPEKGIIIIRSKILYKGAQRIMVKRSGTTYNRDR